MLVGRVHLCGVSAGAVSSEAYCERWLVERRVSLNKNPHHHLTEKAASFGGKNKDQGTGAMDTTAANFTQQSVVVVVVVY